MRSSATNAARIALAAQRVPETTFVDRDGRVAFHVIGLISDAQMRLGLSAAVAGRSSSPVDGGARSGAE